MRRALSEYVVTGIRTTLPFFAWLFEQDAFLSADFHTTYLDGVLAERKGRPFVEPTEKAEEIAAIAVALQAVLTPSGAAAAAGVAQAGGAPARRWKARARAEGLSAGRRPGRD
jgi:acetyl/propionyl-CoA carboxylase alpha subunit